MTYHIRKITLGLLALMLPCLAHAAELSVTIEGLNDELREAVQSALVLQQYVDRDPSPAQIRRLFASADGEIRKALEPYGYYSPTIDSELQPTEKGFNAFFRISPGNPVIVREAHVEVAGEGGQMPAVRRAIRRFRPAVGEQLDHGQYEQSRQAIQDALTETGYLRAEAKVRRVEVMRSTASATINLRFESGPRFRLGEVNFENAQFPDEFLERFVPWRPGEYYSPDALLTLQQRLVDADYFSSVIVTPNVEEAEGLDVPINVALIPAPRSIYTASAHISTDIGPGVQFGFERRWVNRRGHKLDANIEYAQRRQAIGTNYHIPLSGPDQRSLNFGATYRDEDTDTSQSRLVRLTGNETRQWRGFTRTIGLQYLAGDFEVADEQGYSSLLYAEGTLHRRWANDFAFPRRGYSLAFAARFGTEGLLSDTSFTQVTADARWIRAIARRQRVLLRGSLGAMTVDDFDQLPPELRFFAGGDRSVRGFDYRSLGTTNAAGQVIGGEYLATASVEYEYFFLRDWGAAVFTDAGDAFRAGEFDLNIGAGVGIRWRSPVGLVRLDIAKPVMSDLANEIRFHISVGPDL